MLRRFFRYILLPLFLIFSAVLLLRLFPRSSLRDFVSFSTAIYDRNGELIRLTLAPDEQFRIWVPISDIDPRLIEAVKLYEDRSFNWHPGFNPFALARAAFSTYGKGDRQGASTLTMQLARRLYRIRTRTLAGKLKQIAAALWLEARYSKREILEAYLNLAPYGGNIEGVEAASRIYFHKSAKNLTLPEILALAVIPQNPKRRGLKHKTDLALTEARERLFRVWLEKHPDALAYEADMRAPLALFTTRDLPFRAPHLTDKLLRERKSRVGPKQNEIFASVDLRLQTTLEEAISAFLKQRENDGIRNASAILVDRETAEVVAFVGSANYFDQKIQGQVNGIEAKRSPGSTLKSFVYALGIDQGLLHPLTVLKDEPKAFGSFSPENFDGRFMGPVTAEQALIRSRNVPALSVSSKLAGPTLYEFLKNAGVFLSKSDAYYGLSLTLGGGELSGEELASLYLLLANRGILKPLVYLSQKTSETQKNERLENTSKQFPRLLSEEAAFITLKMLEKNPRPDTGLPAAPEVAWKTGTSWGFRDAWTAGVFGRYVLVVWNGNFDGRGNPAFVGIRSAAPLFFRIVDAIRSQGLDPGMQNLVPPAGVSRVEVCAGSGDLPNAWCPEKVLTWFIPGKSPIKVDTLYRPVKIDTRTGQTVCEDGPYVKTEVFEFWPAELERLFKNTGLPRRAPPPLPDCSGHRMQAGSAGPEIIAPRRNLTYLLRISKPTPLNLRADAPRDSGTLFWFVDEGWIGQNKAGENLSWTPATSGRHKIRVIDSLGRANSREVDVEFVH